VTNRSGKGEEAPGQAAAAEPELIVGEITIIALSESGRCRHRLRRLVLFADVAFKELERRQHPLASA
jgi:hypothetical protein